MSTIILHDMVAKKGHEHMEFNSSSKSDLRKMVRYIKEQVEKGKILVGAKKGAELVKLLDRNMTAAKSEYDIEEKLLKNDSFILKDDVKLMLKAPIRGG